MEYDATATTAAGAIKDLSEREILPRVIVVEEIEKADEKALSFLLALCDLRGEIRKTTARATIQRDTKVLVVATVNDVPLFEKMLAGALASRFANKIWFKRPSRETLSRILVREIRKINGDPAWVSPALDYCEERGVTDPRQVIALALCGRDMLVSGAYQKMLSETSQESAE
jgi:MoxR-like ATPase